MASGTVSYDVVLGFRAHRHITLYEVNNDDTDVCVDINKQLAMSISVELMTPKLPVSFYHTSLPVT